MQKEPKIELNTIKSVKYYPLYRFNEQRLLEAILTLTKQKEEITSGKLYEAYTDISKNDAVTYRRIFDFINELEFIRNYFHKYRFTRTWKKEELILSNFNVMKLYLETAIYSI